MGQLAWPGQPQGPIGGRPSRLPIAAQNQPPLKERQDLETAVERLKTGIQTVWDWVQQYWFSVHAHAQAHTHTLAGKELQGRVGPYTRNSLREGVGVSVYWGIAECVCCGRQCVRLS